MNNTILDEEVEDYKNNVFQEIDEDEEEDEMKMNVQTNKEIIEIETETILTPEEEPKLKQIFYLLSNLFQTINQQKTNLFLITIIVLLLVLIGVISIGVILYMTNDVPSTKFDYPTPNFQKEKYTSSPLLVNEGKWNHSFEVDHPRGHFAIHAIFICLIDNAGWKIPFEKIYTQNLFLSIDDTLVGYSFGGNEILFQLPYPTAIQSHDNSKWIISLELFNLIGLISLSSNDVRLQYYVIYSKHSDQIINVEYNVIDGNVPFTSTNIEGVGTPGTYQLVVNKYNWLNEGDLIIHEAHSIVSIGAVRSTLEMLKENGEYDLISYSNVDYSTSGFIKTVDIAHPLYILPSNSTLVSRTIYHNTINFPEVLCSFAFYSSPYIDLAIDP